MGFTGTRIHNVWVENSLTKFAWLSVAAALATIALKAGAYLMTGSVGLLSDAAESVVNLVAALVAVVVLHQAAKPADARFAFGRSKAEYFSAGIEGAMILAAAAVIIFATIERLLNPRPLDNVGVGLLISVVASIINGAVALVLLRAPGFELHCRADLRHHVAAALLAGGNGDFLPLLDLFLQTFGVQFNATTLGKQWRYEAYTKFDRFLDGEFHFFAAGHHLA